jgi:hypothetical protein
MAFGIFSCFKALILRTHPFSTKFCLQKRVYDTIKVSIEWKGKSKKNLKEVHNNGKI